MLHTVTLIAALACRAVEPPYVGLADRLEAVAALHHGKVTIALKHLGTGEAYFRDADDVMPTASLIKLPVMAEVYAQAEARKAKLDDMLTLAKEDMVPGSGILTDHFSPGAKFSLRDAVHLMIVYSDNTATNLVLDKVSIKT